MYKLFWNIFYIILLIPNIATHLFSKRKVIVQDLQIEHCGSKFDPVRFHDIQISTEDNGDLLISGSFDTYEELYAPIQVQVKIERRILGIWTTVPFCYKRFGTCVFDDLCKYGRKGNDCPAVLEEHDIPCECPIPKGRYILPGAQFRVNSTRWAGLLSGNYRGNVKLLRNTELIGCYSGTFKLDRIIEN